MSRKDSLPPTKQAVRDLHLTRRAFVRQTSMGALAGVSGLGLLNSTAGCTESSA